MEGEDKPPLKGEQDEFLKKAKEAISSGDLWGMVEALHESFALDGLTRRIKQKWPDLNDDASVIVAQAVDALYEAFSRGKKVQNIVAYLWKSADNIANDFYRSRQYDVQLEEAEFFYEIGDHSEEITCEKKRAQAIAITRSLLERLGQHNVKVVMSYLLDAVEAGYADVSNEEIANALGLSLVNVRKWLSRGFTRLKRIVDEQGHLEQGVDIGALGRNSEGGPFQESLVLDTEDRSIFE